MVLRSGDGYDEDDDNGRGGTRSRILVDRQWDTCDTPRAAGERKNEWKPAVFFFSFFPHLRHQVPGPIHEILEVSYSGASFIREAKNERPFEGKSRNQKIRPGSRASLSFPSFSFSTGRGERWFQRIGFLFDSPVRVNSMFLTGGGRLFYVTFRWLESIGPRANVFAIQPARVFVPPWEGGGG